MRRIAFGVVLAFLWSHVAGAQSTVTIFSDDFEGSFPGQWAVYGVPGYTGKAYWGKVSCKTSGGTGAVWCAASGNSAPAPCSQYIKNQGTFMIYGPFSLADAVGGTLDFDLWADINDGGDPNNPPDYVMWMWSLDGQDFWGDGISGTTNGWQHRTTQMSDAQVGENPQPILGKTQVWFAFVFISDPATSVLKGGAYIDNVVITKMSQQSCAFSLSSLAQPFASTGGSGSVAINASGSTCAWTAASNSPWITITGAAGGSGNATVTYSVQANLGAARSGTLTIAGQTFTVNQSAASCGFVLSPTSTALPASGGSGSFSVTTGSWCSWTALANAPWLHLTGGAAGTGNGAVDYSVDANPGAARSGSITVQGQSFSVNQAAATCSYALSPTSVSMPATGGSGSFGVTSGSWCSWTALANVTWLHLTGGTSGTGNGAVNYSVDANSGAARSGSITVQGQSFSVNQSTPSCWAQRSLPSGYVPGLPAEVAVQVTPPSGTQTYAVEDTPPSGWSVSAIDNGGESDLGNGKVKWGLFFDATQRTLHYRATPPAGTDGTKTFSGTVSANGLNQVICGDSTVANATYHPADTNTNWRLEIAEATAYGTAWKQGTTWQNPPNPIPIAYVTNAGLLWKSGEVYHYDASQDPPWVPGAGSQAQLQAMNVSAKALAVGSGSAVCTFNPTSHEVGAGVQVSIAVTPGSGTQVYAVEDAPPSGWAVSAIDNGGAFDSTNGKVKWGPFFDDAVRTLDYTVTPPAGTVGTRAFTGTASFDGTDISIGRERTISPGGSISFP